MARKTTSKQSSKDKPLLRWQCPDDAEWGGFINCRLDDQQKAGFESWSLETQDEQLDWLEALTTEGMKVSFAFDAEHDAFIVSLTGRLIEGRNFRCVTSSRGETLMRAVSVALFKHFVVLEQRYDDYKPKSQTFMRFG
jgi:hypothetical protein